MFGILYINEDGFRQFEVFDTQDEARERANNLACMGTGADVTVFDYDAISKTYIEFYRV